MYPKGGSGSGGLPPSVTPVRCVQTGVSNECSSASGTLPRAGKGSGLVQDGWPVSSWMSSNSPEEPQGTVPRSLKGQSKGGTVSCLCGIRKEGVSRIKKPREFRTQAPLTFLPYQL